MGRRLEVAAAAADMKAAGDPVQNLLVQRNERAWLAFIVALVMRRGIRVCYRGGGGWRSGL